ncbi:MAG TPA: hypothetical protein VFD43_14095 [Planctomycetota bacterium]|nr:hypothetical protein [Planctomycetota bacterium]
MEAQYPQWTRPAVAAIGPYGFGSRATFAPATTVWDRSMIQLQCTARLLKRLRVAPAPRRAASDSYMGDWHANVMFLGHTPHVIAVNDESLVTVVLPLKEVGTLVARWRTEVIGLIARLGLPSEVVQAEAIAMQDMAVTRSGDRSSVGCMNEMTRHCRGIYEDRGALSTPDVDRLIENMPCQALRFEIPAQVARRLLRARLEPPAARLTAPRPRE